MGTGGAAEEAGRSVGKHPAVPEKPTVADGRSTPGHRLGTSRSSPEHKRAGYEHTCQPPHPPCLANRGGERKSTGQKERPDGGANVLEVRLLGRLVEIRSQWLTVVGERYEEEAGAQLDYWRVEKADSVVVVTIQRGQLILPPRTFRPGVSRVTLDLPGGRMTPGEPVADAAARVVVRELGLTDTSAIKSVEQLNGTGWDVDSSTSNQRLYGAVCELSEHALVPPERSGAAYPATEAGLSMLLSDLACLQCREVLREWRARW